MESRQKGEWKIPERLIARAFEDAEREVLKDRFALHHLGHPLPEAPVEGWGRPAFLLVASPINGVHGYTAAGRPSSRG